MTVVYVLNLACAGYAVALAIALLTKGYEGWSTPFKATITGAAVFSMLWLSAFAIWGVFA